MNPDPISPRKIAIIDSPRYRGRFAIAVPEFGIPYLAEATLTIAAPHDRHSHAEIQVLWVLEGEMGMEIGRQHVRVGPGHGIVLLPGKRHRVNLPDLAGATATAQIIDLRLIDDPAQPMPAYVRTLVAHQSTGGNVQGVMNAAVKLREAKEASGPARTAKMLSAVWDLLGELSTEPTTQPQSEKRDGDDRRLHIAERFMADHLSDAIGVDAVAEAVGLSRSQLTRLMVEHRGVGPAHTLRQMRVKRASELLKNSTLAIKEIARVCGFVSQSHFSRVFFEETGTRPTAARG